MKEERAFWHEQQPERVLSDLKTTITGLSEKEALERLQIYGPNRLPSSPKTLPFFRFLLQFHNLLIYVRRVDILLEWIFFFHFFLLPNDTTIFQYS